MKLLKINNYHIVFEIPSTFVGVKPRTVDTVVRAMTGRRAAKKAVKFHGISKNYIKDVRRIPSYGQPFNIPRI